MTISFIFGYCQINLLPTCVLENSNSQTTSSAQSAATCNNIFTNFLNSHKDDMIPQGVTRKLKIKTNIIFVQDVNGGGNFTMSNSLHAAFWNGVFTDLNNRINALPQEICTSTCSSGEPTTPAHYSNISIEFQPNYIELKSSQYYDHNTDPDPNHATLSVNSFNKPYLNAIEALAGAEGFNVIVTTDSIDYNNYINNNPNNLPLWDPVLNYTSYYAGHWYSAFPTYDLNHNAVLHLPDAFLLYVNSFDHLGGQWYIDTQYLPWVTGGLLHEYGHYFNLVHSNCSLNVMKPNQNPARTSFSGCQVREMYESIMTKNLRKYVICEDLIDYNLNITTNETWTNNMKVFNNITIKNGAALTLKCELHLQPNTRIIVERGGKLIIDGALLTSCGDKWEGIIVEGNTAASQSAAGIVELKSGSIIENAKVAISCNPYHILWPNNTYYGGLIQANGGTIRNCGKAVEFMKYGTGILLDGSYFNGTTFENCKNGVTLWANSGVKFDDCTFTNMKENGILPLDSWVKVNGCTFNGAKYCISAESTFPITNSSEIGVDKTNNFLPFTDGEGIRATSNGNITRLKIWQNNFLGGSLGAFINGGSEFEIISNDFADQLHTSIPLYATELKDLETEITQNNVSASMYGSAANWTNNNHYWDNCFEYIDNTDILVALGSIHEFQGSADESAGNCFSKNNTNDILTLYYAAPFVYYQKQVNVPPCKIPTVPQPSTTFPPTNPIANYVLQPSNTDSTYVCGSPGSGGPINVKYRRCPMPKTVTEYNTMVGTLTAQIAYLGGLVSLTWHQKYLLKKYKDCLKKVKLYKVILEQEKDKEEGTTGWRDRSIAHLNALPDFQSRIFAYGLLVEDGQYSNARSWLNGLSKTTEEEQDFYTIQSINLDYLENMGTYSVTNTDRNVLYNLGNKTIPLNGYARSLYYTLTGERIPINLYYGDQESNPRQKNNIAVWDVKAYPNPISAGLYNIEIVNSIANEQYAVELTDITGKVVHNQSKITDKNIQIEVSNWRSGLYMYKVQNLATKEVVVNKFIKI